jgi:mannose-6-phosphate isomerase-like protein (cupin superfamily)
MMIPEPTVERPFTPEERPVERITIVDNAGIYVREIYCPAMYSLIPQHVHPYAHVTVVGSGTVRLWRDGHDQGVFQAGSAIDIPKGVEHKFLTLEPHTRLFCIHQVDLALRTWGRS